MTWRVAQLLAELSERGLTLQPEGRNLRVSPPWALTPDLLARIRELKSEILSVLAPPPAFSPCLRPADLTSAERQTLITLAARPGLRPRELAPATRLPHHTFDLALTRLHHRREINFRADGRCYLVVH